MKNMILSLMIISVSSVIYISCVTVSGRTVNEPYNNHGAYTSVPQDEVTKKFRAYGNGFVIINLAKSVLIKDTITRYILKSDKLPEIYCLPDYKAFGDYSERSFEVATKKIRIDGIMVPYSTVNLEPIINDDNTFIPIEVHVGDSMWLFEIPVERVPVEAGMSYDEVISILGQPNDELKGAGDTWGANSLPFQADKRFVSYWVLEYDRYPGLELRFDENGILRESR